MDYIYSNPSMSFDIFTEVNAAKCMHCLMCVAKKLQIHYIRASDAPLSHA